MPKFNPFQELKDMGLPPPRGVLQVGASTGQEMATFVANGIGAGIFIEPLAEPFAALSQACMQRPGYVAVNALCSDETGQKVSFHVASNGGQSSSMLKPKNHLTEFNFVSFDQTVEMVTNRLDHLVAFLRSNGHAAVCDQCDMLYMDTQGAELKVLRGAGAVLDGINYLLTEVTRNEMYAGAPTLNALVAYLEPLGFTLNNVNFSWHHHADALFVRKRVLNMA
jgi:FkbM family methyltransferase